MSLSANRKKNHRSKSLSPSPINAFNQRTCKYHHGNRKIDTSSASSYDCADCKSKIKRYGIVYGCSRCKFYLCSPCFRKPSCANGHLLKAGHVGKNTLCSQCKYKCKKQRLQMYQCNACRFNMCLGCYSYETCSGNHGLKWQKISSATHKSMNNCSKCQRIFKIKKSLFMCKKCKYSLCGDCYQPSLTLKSRIHRHQKITARIQSDQNLLMQQQHVQIPENRLYFDDEKKERDVSMGSGDDADHEREEEEEKSIVLTDDHLMDHNNRYNYSSSNPPATRCSRSTSAQSNSHSKSKERIVNKGSKKKKSSSKTDRKNGKKKGKNKKKKVNKAAQPNNGNINARNTPSLSLSGTSEVNMQYNDNELSSDLDLCGLESCAPSELTRIPSILTDCCICMERDKEVAFLPCGHYIACEFCAKLLLNDTGMCAICSMKIQSILKIYE